MDKVAEAVSDGAEFLHRRSGSQEMIEGDSVSFAWIDGAPATFESAVAEAAHLLDVAAAPVFGHLAADVDGAREAVRLAERVDGVLDHAASAALLADLDPIRESGAMLTTPLEAAIRADVVLLVGRCDNPDWLSRPARPYGEDVPRSVLRLGAADDVLALLATLRACVKGRRAMEPAAATLLQAKFGVALRSAAELEPLAIEAIHGLVRDLNETTRFSSLSAAAPDHGQGVQQVCGWMTGFPLRTGFVSGAPVHDPWRYDARRLVAAGDTDCLIWVSAFEGGAPAPADTAIALTSDAAAARVRFAVSRPGVDSDAVLYDPDVGTFVVRHAAAASTAPTVAAILQAIRHTLGGPPC